MRPPLPFCCNVRAGSGIGLPPPAPPPCMVLCPSVGYLLPEFQSLSPGSGPASCVLLPGLSPPSHLLTLETYRKLSSLIFHFTNSPIRLLHLSFIGFCPYFKETALYHIFMVIYHFFCKQDFLCFF